MKRKLVSLTCLSAVVATMLTVFVLLVPSPAIEAAPQCVHCPLIPLPDECPPCTEWVPGTCKKCAHCERIPGCRS